MGVYGTYELPFETVEVLTQIIKDIENDINNIENELNISNTSIEIPEDKELLKKLIVDRRRYRTKLQNLEIKKDYHENIEKIDEAVEALEDIKNRNRSNLAKKFSIELEKWANVALNIINDAKLINPNYPVGDDNEPIYTAPNGVPDIECYYDMFAAICEVTMLTSRDQWYNEGQPVMRHLRQFENLNEDKPNYCLFIAPTLHVDTVNTFYMSVKYEYEGKPQKIIPITIVQLEKMLKTVKEMSQKGKKLLHSQIMELYEECTNLNDVNSSTNWLEYINQTIDNWSLKLIA